MNSYLTLKGLYNYGIHLPVPIDILSGLKNLPGINTKVISDYDSFIKYLILKSNEFEILYPDLDFMKIAVNDWETAHHFEFEKMYNTMTFEYNPIDNYDRTETRILTENQNSTETRNLTGKRNGTNITENTETDSTSGTDTRTGSENRDKTNTNSTTLNKAGFNSTTPLTSETTSGNDSDTETVANSQTVTTETTGNSSGTNTNTIDTTETDTGTINNEHSINHNETITAKGNIGVTTTQQMINQEREISKFSYIDYVCNAFIDFFCLKIY